jgi:hypothetical protein
MNQPGLFLVNPLSRFAYAQEANRRVLFKTRMPVAATAPSLLISALILPSVSLCGFTQEIPAGFKLERYASVWKRNPFTLVTPNTPQAPVSAFDKLFLTSWLKLGATEVIVVQNPATNETETITAEPNRNNLRIVELHRNSNPQLVEAVISDGRAQGTVKFKFVGQLPGSQTVTEQMTNRSTTSQAVIPRLTEAEGSAEGIIRRTKAARNQVVPGQIPESSSFGRN